MNVEAYLDWLVELNIQFYKTEETLDYKPSGVSHFYLLGSQERFTSAEMIAIYTNNANDDLHQRWLDATAEHSNWKRKHGN